MTRQTDLMLLLALAAQIVAPVAKNPTEWFFGDDTPSYLVREGPGVWQVPIRVIVAPTGSVQGCELEGTSGIGELNKLTCKIMLRRSKFRPASIDGLPVFGVYRTTILWAVANAPFDTSKLSRADIQNTVEHLPQGVTSPNIVGVAFAVDSMGAKSACVSDDTRRALYKRMENHPALVAVACEQIMKNFKAVPALDPVGNRVPSVQNALVEFSTPKKK